MSGFDRRYPPGVAPSATTSDVGTPGKRTRTAGALPRTTRDLDAGPHPVEWLIHGLDAGDTVQRKAVDAGYGDIASAARAGYTPVRRSASAVTERSDAADGREVQQAAANGIVGAGGTLPYCPTIQELFGRHDISGVKAHVGGPAETASRAIGAQAYATGNHVAFAAVPSLHTAAHEAAHVVQQRGGVQLKGGVGVAGDAYEQHADQVAEAVVQGKSAERLLDRYAGGGGGPTPVQRKEALSEAQPAAPATEQEAASGTDAAVAEPATLLMPDDVAEEILRRPELRDDFLEWAEHVGGAGYRDKILAAVAKHPQASPATPPAASATTPVPGKSSVTSGGLPRTTRKFFDVPAMVSGMTAPSSTPPATARPVGQVRVTADGINVRLAPSLSAKVLGGLHRGDVVSTISNEGPWLRFAYQGEMAFIHGDFVEPVTIRTPASSPPSSSLAGTAVTEPTSSAIAEPTHATATSSGAHVTGPAANPSPASPSQAPNTSPPAAPAPQTLVVAAAPTSDQSIESVAAALPNASIAKVTTDLAKLATDASQKKRDGKGEYGAADRQRVVADIQAVRDDLGKIDKTGLDAVKLGQFVALAHRRLDELSTYYYQGYNILTIEDTTGQAARMSTCNMTSLAMSFELLGRTGANYSAEKRPHLLFAARHYHGDLVRADRGATKASGDLSGDWASLLGLRLPDFLELAAVAEYMSAPTDEEAIRAGGVAATEKTNPDILRRLAHRFGVGMETKHIDWNAGEATKLTGVDDLLGQDFGSQRLSVEGMERLRAHADASGKPEDRRRYEAAYEKQQSAMHAKSIDTRLPLDRYRHAVVSQIGPVLDSGAAVMVGAWRHWIRLYSLNDDHVAVQDPGSWDRHEMQAPWEEARAMGYFWTNLVFR